MVIQNINTGASPIADVLRQSSQDRLIILIAEDDRQTRQMFSHILEHDGYRVIEAENGEECLEAYKKIHPNLILLDSHLPGINGFECCEHIMKLPESIYTPVLMITGLEDQTSVDCAFDLGAVDYITKPIHIPALRQRIRILLERTQLYQQLETANRKLTETNIKLEETNQKLTELATTDELTKLSNRRVFTETLSQEWQRMGQEKSSLSLILCDIDHFKIYNDTYGHPEGDKCISQVANVIKESVKDPSILAARYGGEEFVILLPNTSTFDAEKFAENIRLSVKELAIPHTNSPTFSLVTMSLGVAGTIPSPDINDTEILLQAADKALYQAKANGRDRVVVDQSSNLPCI